MLRKMAFIAMAMVLVLGTVVSMASAAQNVANTNQKGSLLIWPKIATFDGFRTIITIGNDYYGEVWVKCYWVDQEQEIQDFMFRLTPNQPVYFDAATGEGGVMTVPPFPGTVGELKCWAVKPEGDNQIAFNHLYGSAIVIEDFMTAFEYNAWSFTARGVAQGTNVGTGGNLLLNGLAGGYDACPQYLVENFISSRQAEAMGREPYVALVPCKQDLRQDRYPTCTKAKYDVWNENETKYTGAHRCIKCWFEGALDQIDVYTPGNGFGYGADKFTWTGLHTFLARFRVTGVASTVCVRKFLNGVNDRCTLPGQPIAGQVNSPLLGVLYHDIRYDGLPPMLIGTTPHTAGADGSGFVLWDVEGGHPEAPTN